MSLASDRAEDVGESKGSTGNNCACGKPRARSSRQCRECGSQDSQKHHADYSKPLEVEWLCRDCHEKLHKAEADAVRPLLTRRETEIVLLICDGLSEKEIAGRLGVAPATVSTFKGKAYKKIGVHKETALVRWAIRTGRVVA